MIRFMMVQGDVLVDDPKNGYRQMARSGMELDESGSYLIATTPHSTAQIAVAGRIISLAQSSFLRVSRARTWHDTHNVGWSRDAKLFIGKLWSQIAGDGRDPGDVGTGGGGGVRG
jgi:hypothetical protein